MSEVLALWERACAAGADRRGDALLGDAAPVSLSARNAALMELRVKLFGARQELLAACPACGLALEFTIDCAALADSLKPGDDAAREHVLECDGYRIAFRAPDVDDWHEATRAADFADALLRRAIVGCVRGDGGRCDCAALPARVTDALSDALDALEPGACVDFDLCCPECAAEWSAPMDCAAVLYRELLTRAEAMLVEVDALARAYGWSEAQVLGLSPTRRAAYLQLLGVA